MAKPLSLRAVHHAGLITPTGKVAFGLGLIWACVLCLGQAARFYVHLVCACLMQAYEAHSNTKAVRLALLTVPIPAKLIAVLAPGLCCQGAPQCSQVRPQAPLAACSLSCAAAPASAMPENYALDLHVHAVSSAGILRPRHWPSLSKQGHTSACLGAFCSASA